MANKNLNFEEEYQAEFNWDMALAELDSEKDLMLNNILRTYQGPICFLKDQSEMTLLHHAVLKGVVGKTMLLLDFAYRIQKTPIEMLL